MTNRRKQGSEGQAGKWGDSRARSLYNVSPAGSFNPEFRGLASLKLRFLILKMISRVKILGFSLRLAWDERSCPNLCPYQLVQKFRILWQGRKEERRKEREAFSRRAEGKTCTSLEEEIQNHNNKTCQDSAASPPSFTAPSHQGELKKKKKKVTMGTAKLSTWIQTGFSFYFSASVGLGSPARHCISFAFQDKLC